MINREIISWPSTWKMYKRRKLSNVVICFLLVIIHQCSSNKRVHHVLKNTSICRQMYTLTPCPKKPRVWSRYFDETRFGDIKWYIPSVVITGVIIFLYNYSLYNIIKTILYFSSKDARFLLSIRPMLKILRNHFRSKLFKWKYFPFMFRIKIWKFSTFALKLGRKIEYPTEIEYT